MVKKQIVKNLNMLFNDEYGSKIERDLINARDLLEHDEWGEALDIFCCQLYEYSIPISQDTFSLIQETWRLMDVDLHFYEYLTELIILNNEQSENYSKA
ncbi:MAG: hypothetical protein CSA81_12220 [Acidobacteria bacterium]|nr:MAG: hypothetical protein CSA81_12220 [Acidobacteriota bacterium]